MQLYDYQKQYLATMPENGIMHADLGTGKTAMSLMHWGQQHKLLVVAPASKIRTGDWQEEVENWLGSRAILHEKQGDKIVRFKPNSIISTNDSNAYITKFTYPDITYISYESLRLMDKDTRRPRWWKYTGARNGGIVYDIIADECQSIKNPQSKQAKAVYEIVQSGGQFIGLSGTPMSNGWIDFAGYSKLFGFTKGITEFKQKYCNINTFAGFPRIVGYFNTEEMNRQWHLISRSLTREQAHELPDRQFIGKTIMLDPKEQKDYYNAKIVRTTKTGELLDNPSLLLNYLRQVGVASRLDVLSDILDDTSENIVIFYNYISERKAILEYIAKYHKDKKVLRYDGEKHSTLPKSDAQLKNTVLVAHYKSASTGLNLQWATVTVFFSLTYSYQEFEQSIGRTHRTGQTKKCVFYIFKAKNTVDEDIYAALRDKKDFSTKLWEVENESNS